MTTSRQFGVGMIGVEVYHSIKTMHKQGHSQRKIAEELSLSKTTVGKYINMTLDEFMELINNSIRESSFAICEQYVRERLSKYPRLRASVLYLEVKKKFPEIKAKDRAFRDFVRKLKQTYPVDKYRNYAVIETAPGVQVQVDPGEMKVVLGNKRQRVYFIVFVLSTRVKAMSIGAQHHITHQGLLKLIVKLLSILKVSLQSVFTTRQSL